MKITFEEIRDKLKWCVDNGHTNPSGMAQVIFALILEKEK
jgi:hypothetical protein